MIVSGWIDHADPDALLAGDYLSVLDSSGTQIYYQEAADILADPIKGRQLLCDFIKACAGESQLCRYCGGACPTDPDNCCDGYAGDIDGLYSQQKADFVVEDIWAEHPDYPLRDWQYLVQNNETRAAYWDYVKQKLEEASEDGNNAKL